MPGNGSEAVITFVGDYAVQVVRVENGIPSVPIGFLIKKPDNAEKQTKLDLAKSYQCEAEIIQNGPVADSIAIRFARPCLIDLVREPNGYMIVTDR